MSNKAQVNLVKDYFTASCILYILLEDNCFTMLCSFLLYVSMNQLCVYVWRLPFEPPYHPTPPSHPSLGHHRAELPVSYCSFPWAILHMLVYICQCCSFNLSHMSILYVCLSAPLLSNKKEPNWVGCSDVDERRACHTGWGKKEKSKYHILMHIHEI